MRLCDTLTSSDPASSRTPSPPLPKIRLPCPVAPPTAPVEPLPKRTPASPAPDTSASCNSASEPITSSPASTQVDVEDLRLLRRARVDREPAAPLPSIVSRPGRDLAREDQRLGDRREGAGERDARDRVVDDDRVAIGDRVGVASWIAARSVQPPPVRAQTPSIAASGSSPPFVTTNTSSSWLRIVTVPVDGLPISVLVAFVTPSRVTVKVSSVSTAESSAIATLIGFRPRRQRNARCRLRPRSRPAPWPSPGAWTTRRRPSRSCRRCGAP